MIKRINFRYKSAGGKAESSQRLKLCYCTIIAILSVFLLGLVVYDLTLNSNSKFTEVQELIHGIYSVVLFIFSVIIAGGFIYLGQFIYKMMKRYWNPLEKKQASSRKVNSSKCLQPGYTNGILCICHLFHSYLLEYFFSIKGSSSLSLQHFSILSRNSLLFVP